MLARLRRAAPRDDGASAVEFALVLPLLIILVFGIIAFGIVFAQSLALGNAAREGARSGVVQQRTCGEILASVQGAANSIAMAGENVSVLVTRTGAGTRCAEATSYVPAAADVVPCEGSTTGDEITVSTNFESELIIPLIFTEPEFNLGGTGVFRCEFS